MGGEGDHGPPRSGGRTGSKTTRGGDKRKKRRRKAGGDTCGRHTTEGGDLPAGAVTDGGGGAPPSGPTDDDDGCGCGATQGSTESGASRKRTRVEVAATPPAPEEPTPGREARRHHGRPPHRPDADAATAGGEGETRKREGSAERKKRKKKSKPRKEAKRRRKGPADAEGGGGILRGDGGGDGGDGGDDDEHAADPSEGDGDPPPSPGSGAGDRRRGWVDRRVGNVQHAPPTGQPKKRKRKGTGRPANDANGRMGLMGEADATSMRPSDAGGAGNLDAAAPASTKKEPSSLSFPFETDPDDHCESPLEAYEHILPLLRSLDRRTQHRSDAKQQQQQQQHGLSIYDPYYCNGQVTRHLTNLGFPNVYNRREDCYAVWDDPARYRAIGHDVLVTNPPYSGDHVETLMRHVTSVGPDGGRGTPYLLLMPTYVHKKAYFQDLTSAGGQRPIYLVPDRRYVYQPPPDFRSKKASDTHKKSSPFVSMWYCWGGSQEVTDEWYRILQAHQAAAGGPGGGGRGGSRSARAGPAGATAATAAFSVARSKSALRDLRRTQK